MAANSMPRNIETAALQQGAIAATPAGLDTLYKHLTDFAKRSMDWYARSKRSKSILAQVCRYAAVIAAALGALMPVLATLLPESTDDSQYLLLGLPVIQSLALKAGYVFVALAGMFIAFDRFLGYTPSYVRYTTALLAISDRKLKLEVEWGVLLASGVPQSDPESRARYTALLINFASDISTIIESETAEWAAEYKASLAALDTQVRTDAATYRKMMDDARAAREEQEKARREKQEADEKSRASGGLDVTLTTQDPGPFEVDIDDEIQHKNDKSKSWSFVLPPGMHRITITNAATPPISASKTAIVTSGAVATLAITL